MTDLIRNRIKQAFASTADHPGLLFDRGMPRLVSTPAQRGEEIAQFLRRVAAQPVPSIYSAAYARWLKLTSEKLRFHRWLGQIDGRLVIGLGNPHVLETNVTLQRVYGVPMLPGSTLKGLARAQARLRGFDAEVMKVLFGDTGNSPEEAESGYLLFHDAWWVPESAPTPLVSDVVTVHHPRYYESEGRVAASDLDSPNPNAQLAVRGEFLVVVEGVANWGELGLKLVREALQYHGGGGKTAAGYGYFERQPAGEAEAKLTMSTARHPWVEEQLVTIQKENNSSTDEVLRGRRLAAAWAALDDADTQQAALADIRARWEAKGWWGKNKLPGKAAKAAYALYSADDESST